MTIKRNVLLNPGAATTTDTVKMAQVVPDIVEFFKVFRAALDEYKIKVVYNG